jgi:hypothetical protein
MDISRFINTTLRRPLKARPTRGQSFVELAIMMPIMILLIAGMTEVVFVFNDFLQMLDGVRAGARYISDSNPYPTDLGDPANPTTVPSGYDKVMDCNTTLNFFRQAACVTEKNLLPITLKYSTATSRARDVSTGQCKSPSPHTDDIVISIFGTHVWDPSHTGTNQVDTVRYYNNMVDTTPTPDVGKLVVDDFSNPKGKDSGWSRAEDLSNGQGGMCSQFTFGQVQALLINSAPSTGIVLVEVFYGHAQLFDLPVFYDFIPNPIPLWTYAFFPLVSAEPTVTPAP